MDTDIEEYIDVPELFTSGRQQVIEYLTDQYGADNMCQILALGTMGTRVVLKDTGRALGIDHNEITAINKYVPAENGKQWSLSDCLYGDESKGREPVPEIVGYARIHPELFEIALQFEGLPRHTSIHAAGVAISPRPVTEVLPLCLGKDGQIVSQIDKDLVEELGLIKMDLLGLRTLGVMHKCVDNISERHGINIDLDKINIEDPMAMKIISDGNTDGIFQIESAGMSNIFKQLNKVNFDSIIVALSLNIVQVA